jgi:hypothetical protein
MASGAVSWNIGLPQLGCTDQNNRCEVGFDCQLLQKLPVKSKFSHRTVAHCLTMSHAQHTEGPVDVASHFVQWRGKEFPGGG